MDRAAGCLETQARIVATEEQAFKSRLSRQIPDDLADIERLDTAQASAATGPRRREEWIPHRPGLIA